MSTRPYSELLAQVEALAGASLVAAEQARVKIFANRRARKAYRESPYWQHLLRVGEERIVSSTGLLPLTETGKDDIDMVIRIHAEEPFKTQDAFEYGDYYADSTGIQITNYTPSEATESGSLTVSGNLNPDYTGDWIRFGTVNGYSAFSRDGLEPTGATQTIYVNSALTSYVMNTYPVEALSEAFFNLSLEVDGGTWTAALGSSGSPEVVVNTQYSAWVTYYTKLTDTYGEGDGEESDVPDAWFDYMAQGSYADWLRSDGQTEKAMVEDQTANELLNQQLEKVSRQNGNQVVTRVMTHANTQMR